MVQKFRLSFPKLRKVNYDKILIVDDEPAMRLGLKDNLEFEGYQVEIAEDGEVGIIKKFENETFDLIVLDVMMPKISWF